MFRAFTSSRVPTWSTSQLNIDYQWETTHFYDFQTVKAGAITPQCGPAVWAEMASDAITTIRHLFVYLRGALEELKSSFWIHGVGAVGAARDLSAVEAVAESLDESMLVSASQPNEYREPYFHNWLALDTIADVAAYASALLSHCYGN